MTGGRFGGRFGGRVSGRVDGRVDRRVDSSEKQIYCLFFMKFTIYIYLFWGHFRGIMYMYHSTNNIIGLKHKEINRDKATKDLLRLLT